MEYTKFFIDTRSKLMKNVNTPIIRIWKTPPESDAIRDVEPWKRLFESEPTTQEIEETLLCAHSKNTQKSTVCIYVFRKEGKPSASIPPDL